MSSRHKAREYALQMLFQWEIGRQQPQRIRDGFWRIASAEKSTRAFADELFESTAASSAELDALVARHIDNWRLERMAVIDRAILRLAVNELRMARTPMKVVMNEAIELAKKFSSEDAGSFVNGILDSFARTLPKKEKEK